MSDYYNIDNEYKTPVDAGVSKSTSVKSKEVENTDLAKKIKDFRSPDFLDKNKKSIKWGVIGGGGGLVFAFSKKKNYIMYIAIGALAGVVLSNVISKYTTTETEEFNDKKNETNEKR